MLEFYFTISITNFIYILFGVTQNAYSIQCRQINNNSYNCWYRSY